MPRIVVLWCLCTQPTVCQAGPWVARSSRTFLPWNEWYVDSVWSFLEVWHTFSAMMPCSISWSHSCSGHSLLVEHGPLMTWCFCVWSAHSVALTWWLDGSTNCHLQSFCSIYCLRDATAWFSVMLHRGLGPFFSMSSNITSKVLLVVALSRSSTGNVWT